MGLELFWGFQGYKALGDFGGFKGLQFWEVLRGFMVLGKYFLYDFWSCLEFSEFCDCV